HLALTATQLVFVELGRTNPAAARVAAVSRQGGAVVTLVQASAIAVDPHRPTDLAIDPAGVIHFPIAMAAWPLSGQLCTVLPSGSGRTCAGYSPPGPELVALDGATSVWSTLRTVV